jgi:hypothetical protein
LARSRGIVGYSDQKKKLNDWSGPERGALLSNSRKSGSRAPVQGVKRSGASQNWAPDVLKKFGIFTAPDLRAKDESSPRIRTRPGLRALDAVNSSELRR